MENGPVSFLGTPLPCTGKKTIINTINFLVSKYPFGIIWAIEDKKQFFVSRLVR